MQRLKKVDLLVGAQWGDEGKGKVVDMLGSDVDVFVRFQGGANAGHTVIVDGKKIVFHLLPSGMLYTGKLCVLGNGLVLDPEQFIAEVNGLLEHGQDRARLVVSPHAHVVMRSLSPLCLPFHHPRIMRATTRPRTYSSLRRLYILGARAIKVANLVGLSFPTTTMFIRFAYCQTRHHQ